MGKSRTRSIGISAPKLLLGGSLTAEEVCKALQLGVCKPGQESADKTME